MMMPKDVLFFKKFHVRKDSARRVVYVGVLLMIGGVMIGCDRHTPPSPTTVRTQPSADTFANYTKPEPDNLYTIPSVVPPAPKPTEPLPDKASCVTARCHASYRSSPQLHTPVAQGNCQICHKSEEGTHVYPLKRSINQTCRFCHPIGKTKTYPHQAIEKNNCTLCHNPHASKNRYLLNTADISMTCLGCHDLPPGQYKHTPYDKADCTACHNPHESDNARLLRQQTVQRNCFTCHQDIQLKIQNAAMVHPPAAENCVTCHSPHASDQPHQLRQPLTGQCLSCHDKIAKHVEKSPISHDAVFIKESCGNCHDPHASGRRHLLRDRVDRLCLNCHDKSLKTTDGRRIASMKNILAKPYLHGPIRSGDCSACHNVHGSKHTRLLRQTFSPTFYADFNLTNYLLCFECHDKQLVLAPRTDSLTEFRKGNLNLHYLHVNRKVKGRSCKACHAIHGSNLPGHLAEKIPFEGSGWSMPLRFQKLPDGGRCAPGCHKPQTYLRTGSDGASPLQTSSHTRVHPSDSTHSNTGQPRGTP